MTDDNWETVKLAIGFINGTYSVNAEVIAGTILAGENLIISNTGGTFTVDGKGATMTNGSISTQLKDSNGNIASEIVLNPEQGFSISNMKSEDEDKRVFYADTQGNLHFKGDLTGATGSFSGDISGGSIYIPNKSSYNFSVDKEGHMTCKGANISGTLNAVGGTFTGTLRGVDGDFSGTINASQITAGTLDCSNLTIDGLDFSDLQGDLTYSQMAAIEIDADQITTGKLSADRIDTGSLYVSRIELGDTHMECDYDTCIIYGANISLGGPGNTSISGTGNFDLSGTMYVGQGSGNGLVSSGNIVADGHQIAAYSAIFEGWCFAPEWSEGSDKKLKTSIKKLDEKAVLLIEKLNPVQYHYKVDDGCRFGFIAQEVQNALKVSGFTENKTVVTSHHMPDDAEGETTLGLRYTDLIAPIVVAVQQQQKEIYNLKNEIKKLKESIKL